MVLSVSSLRSPYALNIQINNFSISSTISMVHRASKSMLMKGQTAIKWVISRSNILGIMNPTLVP